MIFGKIDQIGDDTLVGRLWHPELAGRLITFGLLVNGTATGTHKVLALLAGEEPAPGAEDTIFRVRVSPALLKKQKNIFEIVVHADEAAPGAMVPFYAPNGGGSREGRPESGDHPQTGSDPAPRANGAVTPPPALVSPAAANGAAPPAGPGLPAHAPRAARTDAAVPRIERKPIAGSREDKAEAAILAFEPVGKLLEQLIAAGKIPQGTLSTIMEGYFKAENWVLVRLIFESLPKKMREVPKFMMWYARSLIYIRDYAVALPILEKVAQTEPDKHGQIFYLGIVHSRLSQWEAAAEVFRTCIAQNETEPKYHQELARVLVQIGFGSYGASSENRAVLADAARHFRRTIELSKNNSRACRELAPLLMFFGETEAAIAMAMAGVKFAPKDAHAYADLARIQVAANRIAEAHEAIVQAAALNPTADGIKFSHRLISRLLERPPEDRDGSIEVIPAFPQPQPETLPPGVSWQQATGKPLSMVLEQSSAAWIVFDPTPFDPYETYVSLTRQFGFGWAAGIRFEDGGPVIAFRRQFLCQLLAAGLVAADASHAEVADLAARYGQIVTAVSRTPITDLPGFANGRGVLLVSQFGAQKFGGAEHFLEQMAHLYRGLGFEPLIVGTRAEQEGQSGEINGIRFTFVDGSAESLLALAIDHDAAIVHVVSGLGYEVATTFRFADIRVIFGVHFWREAFRHPTPSAGYFPDIDIRSEKRPEFHTLLQDVDGIYSNSHYTTGMLERPFGVRTPVIFSLPDDNPQATGDVADPSGRDFVLLANARADKGFDLIVAVAKLVPHVAFRAIVSQSGADAAHALIRQHAVSNVELISRVDDMSALYARARAIAVPSYKFVETFSRVVIEAHRHGVPVVGSDRGNVPHLLIESGVSLPEDAAAWASEIDRLFADDAYWMDRSAKAIENSRRYSFAMQEGRLKNLVSGLASPLLVGVGSGLGNIIHTTPVIRNLARRLGRPVDVVVAGDYESLLFILGRQEYVNHVFTLGADVLSRRYDAVFLTHSFGAVPTGFSSARVYDSRKWDNFHADHAFHEAEFNLAAAEALLGVDYDTDDVGGYFLGSLRYEKPEIPLVGMHAGSKGGIWASKRWPYYDDLAKRLKKKGVRVASFGTPDEFVPGTIDMTGGSIEEMARKMLACSHFVANDSGVMNVANALGIPLTALFAPTNARTRGPLMPSSRAIAIEKECAPCECHPEMRKVKFATGTCGCIAEIPVSDVLKVMEV